MPALRAQRNIQDVVFGPYDSRRFGKSLGVNPLPAGAKLCNLDCVYCECSSSAWSPDWELRPQFPDAENVARALNRAAVQFAADDLDSITIAGNGEPTLSPHLDEIVDVVCQARDRDWPQAQTVILTNGTTCHAAGVRGPLAKLDARIVKLDAGSNWILEQLNRPAGKLSVAELVRRISMMPEIIVQSMFVQGPVDNTRPEHVKAWIRWLEQISPAGVQIYSLDREPALAWVRAVPRGTLESIARQVAQKMGIPARVF